MNSQVAERFRTIATSVGELCEACGVERLELFGSGTGESWKSTESDVDLLVRFRVPSRAGIADDYLRLAEGLESLLGARVDLLTEDSVRNPYFRASIDRSRQPVYAG